MAFMDDQRFDAVVRWFGSPPLTHRRGLLGLAAGLATLAFGDATSAPLDADACVPSGQRCGKRAARNRRTGRKRRNRRNRQKCSRCCTRYVTRDRRGNRRCACRPDGDACRNPRECCDGRCTNGVCGPCAAGRTSCPMGCVDVATDRDNCGGCGHACRTGQSCAAGRCVCTTETCDGCCQDDLCRPGTRGGACGVGGEICAVCPDFQRCDSGRCACTASSVDNTACGVNGVCVDGRCFRSFPACTVSSGCTEISGPAANANGANLCVSAGATIGPLCTTTADCAAGEFCVVTEEHMFCIQGCSA